MRKITHIEGSLETRLLSIILVDEDQNYWPTLNRLIGNYPEIGSVRIAAYAGIYSKVGAEKRFQYPGTQIEVDRKYLVRFSSSPLDRLYNT